MVSALPCCGVCTAGERKTQSSASRASRPEGVAGLDDAVPGEERRRQVGGLAHAPNLACVSLPAAISGSS